MTRILSIQSHVLHGHVGNAAAVPAMRLLGSPVTAVPTTLLSNHPHYPTMRGRVLDATLVEDLLLGVEERGLIEQSTILVTGFLGSAANGAVVADFVDRAKARHPGLIFICDPVIGDHDLGAFVDPALIPLFRERLLPHADIITPNGWEAMLIAGATAPIADFDLLHRLRDAGHRDIVITGGHSAQDRLRTLVLAGDTASAIETPRLPARPAGTGDFFTGILAAHIAAGHGLTDAAAGGVAATFAMLEQTGDGPWAEMPIEQGLDRRVLTRHRFTPVPIGSVA